MKEPVRKFLIGFSCVTAGFVAAGVTIDVVENATGYKPAAAVASPADRAAAAILTANIAHYRDEFQQGQNIVGTTQYADAWEGLAAMEDPTSAAARFRDYRQFPGPETDVSYMDAFRQADNHLTAANEPPVISDWMNDMGTMQTDLNKWVHVVVDYQIRNRSQTDLDAAAATVNEDLAKADADTQAVAGN